MYAVNMAWHAQNSHESQVKRELLNLNHRWYAGTILIINRQVFARGAHFRKGADVQGLQFYTAMKALGKFTDYPVASPLVDIPCAVVNNCGGYEN